ncbi:MAG: ATP-binding protein [Deltaproteobacteria bacterium]|jgi:hypothetical protein|nr:ATP-binding protein [Deltaproteobacteria bacterium]
MYYPRIISSHIQRLAAQYPVVTITGPRQSGKTTLCKKLFADLEYVTLEDLSNRAFATEDPQGFLARYNSGVILDEIQRVPSLLSYIQGVVDAKDQNGLFILTGSQQLELMDRVNQSLAGRTAIVKLLPLSYHEIYRHQETLPTLESVLYYGFYPRIFKEKLNPTEMYSFYTNTYLERDIRSIFQVKDLVLFENFLKLCAGRNGQVLNYSSLASDCGIDQKTAKQWLSILEASYVIKRLAPYYKNLNKRVIKAPKLYFYDSGLVCYLLGIRSAEQLNQHPLAGAIFESYVLSELWKHRYNKIQQGELYYFRDSRGREVDVVFEEDAELSQLEIKMGKTIMSKTFSALKYLPTLIGISQSWLVYGGDDSYQRSGYSVLSWREVANN